MNIKYLVPDLIHDVVQMALWLKRPPQDNQSLMTKMMLEIH